MRSGSTNQVERTPAQSCWCRTGPCAGAQRSRPQSAQGRAGRPPGNSSIGEPGQTCVTNVLPIGLNLKTAGRDRTTTRYSGRVNVQLFASQRTCDDHAKRKFGGTVGPFLHNQPNHRNTPTDGRHQRSAQPSMSRLGPSIRSTTECQT